MSNIVKTFSKRYVLQCSLRVTYIRVTVLQAYKQKVGYTLQISQTYFMYYPLC
jgi:hypothetical protein